jgi:hypothetical protein
MQNMVKDETWKLAALATFLRVYGVLSLIIFVPLFVGFAVQTPLLAEGATYRQTHATKSWESDNQICALGKFR